MKETHPFAPLHKARLLQPRSVSGQRGRHAEGVLCTESGNSVVFPAAQFQWWLVVFQLGVLVACAVVHFYSACLQHLRPGVRASLCVVTPLVMLQTDAVNGQRQARSSLVVDLRVPAKRSPHPGSTVSPQSKWAQVTTMPFMPGIYSIPKQTT